MIDISQDLKMHGVTLCVPSRSLWSAGAVLVVQCGTTLVLWPKHLNLDLEKKSSTISRVQSVSVKFQGSNNSEDYHV